MNFISNIKFLSRLIYNNIREIPNDREKCLSDPIVNNSINWYGHATTIINLDNIVIATDPVSANYLGFFKRVIERPYNIKEQKFDYILLSHGHTDHIHFPSLRKLNKDAIVIVPKGYKRLVKLLGFKNVVLLRSGEVYEDDNIKISSIKANHDGRRYYVGIDDESNSYLIERKDKKVFFAGDTAYTEEYNDLECDVAIMPVGCYKPDRFTYMHCSPKQSYDMYKKMKSSVMIPVHYKTFKISLEDFVETENILKSLNDDSVKIINVGATYKL